MSKENESAKGVEAPAGEQREPALSPEMIKVFIQAQEILKAAPWVGIGAVLTAFGAVLLYVYFQSIDYVPTDIPAILAASAAVAALAFGFMFLMVAALIAPRWGFQSAGLVSRLQPEAHKDRLWGVDWLLVAFQLVGPGVLFLIQATKSWFACTNGWGYLALPGLFLVFVGVAVWTLEERKGRGAFFRGARKNWMGFLMPFWSLPPFIALFVFLIPSQGVAWTDLGILFVVWTGLVFCSATLQRDLPVWGLAFIAFMLLPALLFSAPALVGRPSAFPTKVAELAGIRDKLPQELRVPKDVCALIWSGLQEGQTVADLQCESTGEWGAVKAQVLSNLGERWLIEVAVDDPCRRSGGGKLRVTIPSSGVQAVRRIEAEVKSSGRCSPHPW